jgi:hypothetical protein
VEQHVTSPLLAEPRPNSLALVIQHACLPNRAQQNKNILLTHEEAEEQHMTAMKQTIQCKNTIQPLDCFSKQVW